MTRKFDYDDLHRRWLAGESLVEIGLAYGMTSFAVAVRIKRVRSIEGEARWPWRSKSRHSAAPGRVPAGLRTLPLLPSEADC